MRSWHLLVASAVALAGCADSSREATSPTAPPPAPATAAPAPSPSPTTTRCVSSEGGYAVSYPRDWSVAGGDGIEPCAFFDPQPLALEPGTEATEVAVRVDVRDVPLEQARQDTGGQQEEQAAGVRATGTTTDDVLLPAGTPFTTWLVDLGGRTLVLTTNRTDEAVEVLDAMAQSVERL